MADIDQIVELPAGGVQLLGTLVVPPVARGVALLARVGEASRIGLGRSVVAEAAHRARFATLSLDLLADSEQCGEPGGRDLRFDLVLLAGRVVEATDWLRRDDRTSGLPIGYAAASTAVAAALIAAVRRPDDVSAVISLGGRPDLAAPWLARVSAPTLLVVGGKDRVVLRFNRLAFEGLTGRRELVVLPGVGHLFEENGALEHLANMTAAWLTAYLPSAHPFRAGAYGHPS